MITIRMLIDPELFAFVFIKYNEPPFGEGYIASLKRENPLLGRETV